MWFKTLRAFPQLSEKDLSSKAGMDCIAGGS